ncbi:ATP-binding protein [Paenibacillus polymyxa]|uniref:ATP-binding protein n=1 Tax=Paenibacillus polymyxa TaxID=1406 RepID=UPI00234907AF|nr:ATP-binding protein [Paenibacillus polymyxa]WCM62196.1 ATP-binding protein [Paenibacillus polymyxa]
MKKEVINPNIRNFIVSLRDVGYTFDVAVADVLDNSIAAQASEIHIQMLEEPELIFCMLDNGNGMTTTELIEAMRLGTKNPNEARNKSDLGRFGLGLKTASFSQCKRLTVISKKNKKTSVRQWDLDYIADADEWILLAPSLTQLNSLPMLKKLKNQDSGTLIVWQGIDSVSKAELSSVITNLRRHLSLVFHQFLEGGPKQKAINIQINNNPLVPFNPFNINHPATQQLTNEKLKIGKSTITVQPYILPHHSKLSQQEYEEYATDEGYTRSQGFYLYRSRRLLIYGTWWGLHRANDAHKLVRIKIDITNDQDKHWGIDIKKSTASPIPEIKNDLKRIIRQVTEKGSRPYTGRGKKIEDKTTTKFWQLVPHDSGFRFILNQEHPLLEKLQDDLSGENRQLLDMYLKGLQAYLPLEAIQAQLQQNPYEVQQETLMTEEDIRELADKLKAAGLSEDAIKDLLKTEIFKNREGLLKGGH